MSASGQVDASKTNGAVTPEEQGLIDRLADEYKILQDKIDKIGAFRFTIKGWSITVVIAALFASSATSSVSPILLLVCLLVVVVLFFFVEKKQTDLSHYFGERTISIETAISRILRKSARAAGNNDFVMLRFVPGIAHHLRRQHPNKDGQRSKWQSLIDADIIFYSIQALIVIAVVALHSSSSKPFPDNVTIFNGAGAVPVSDRDPRSAAPGKNVQSSESGAALPDNDRATTEKQVSMPKATAKSNDGNKTKEKSAKQKSN